MDMTAIMLLAVAFVGALAVGLTSVADQRKQRKLLQTRLASVSPAQAPIRQMLQARARVPILTRLLAPVFDPILKINRRIAADEPAPIIPFLILGGLAGTALFFVLNGLFSLPALLAAGAGAIAGIFVGRMAVDSRRDGVLVKMEDEFQQALGVIIRCVRAGLPVTEGMRAVAAEVPAPTGPELRRCVDQIQLGEDFDIALAKLADRCAIADYRFFGTAVSLQRQTGGNLTETLDNLAETVRRRKAIRLRAQALTAETKATVTVLAILPAAVGGLLFFVNRDYIMQLFTTDAGRTVLGAAIGVQSFGLYVIRTIIKRSLG